MDNNKFRIEVVTNIPQEKEPGVLYINASMYADKIENYGSKFLIHGIVRDQQIEESVKEPKEYLGYGVDKDVIACVSDSNSIDSDRIIVTPQHPGFDILEPDSSMFYLDSRFNKLYAAVDEPRVNGYRVLSSVKEQEIIYQDDITKPIIVTYADYSDTQEVETVQIFYEEIGMDDESGEEYTKYLPSNVIEVHSEEELHNLTPSFLGLYKVINDADNTFVPYIYNPYTEIKQEFFNFNCDVIY